MFQINRCQECQYRGRGLEKVRCELTQVASRSEAWYLVGMDLIGPLDPPSARGHLYLLTMVDYFTKWCEAIPIASKDAKTVSWAVFHNVFRRFGPPARIITDNGREFCNEVKHSRYLNFRKKRFVFLLQINKEMNEILGVKHARIRPHHPQANGMIERKNREIKELVARQQVDNDKNHIFFRKMGFAVKRAGPDWDIGISRTLMELNITKRRPTGFSPFELMHTWKFRINTNEKDDALDNVIETMDAADQSAESAFDDACVRMVERYERVHELVRKEAEQNIIKEKGRQKRDYHSRHLGDQVELQVGERSLIAKRFLISLIYFIFSFLNMHTFFRKSGSV